MLYAAKFEALGFTSTKIFDAVLQLYFHDGEHVISDGPTKSQNHAEETVIDRITVRYICNVNPWPIIHLFNFLFKNLASAEERIDILCSSSIKR